MKIKNILLIATVGVLSFSSTGLIIPNYISSSRVHAAEEQENTKNEAELHYVETIEEVYNTPETQLRAMPKVNKQEMTNEKAKSYVKELRNFSTGISKLSVLTGLFPWIGTGLSLGFGLTSLQAGQIADKVEEANKGNGVIQVINLETGAYSFQTR